MLYKIDDFDWKTATHEECYMWYDGPLCFTLIHKPTNKIFFAYCYDMDAKGNNWYLLLEVTQERLDQVLNKQIDLYEFLVETEGERLDFCWGKDASFNPWDKEIKYPDRGVRLF